MRSFYLDAIPPAASPPRSVRHTRSPGAKPTPTRVASAPWCRMSAKPDNIVKGRILKSIVNFGRDRGVWRTTTALVIRHPRNVYRLRWIEGKAILTFGVEPRIGRVDVRRVPVICQKDGTEFVFA